MGVANLALRGAQVVITVAELGLTAYATYLAFQTVEICQYDAFQNAVICTDYSGGGVSGIGAFLLFNCVWTMIILAVLCLVPLCVKLHPIAVAVLDGLTMLFWFSSAIGFAVAVGTAASYIGSSNGLAIPGAMAGLAFLIWLLFLASFIINVRAAMAARKGGASHSYGTSTPGQGPNNFPTQAGHPMQSPSKEGTYVQSMPSPQQQYGQPMQSPQQQYGQPMQSPQQQYGQPMHSPQQQPQQQYGQPMPHQSPTQLPVHQQSPAQQYQQPMHPQQQQQQQQNQWAQPTSSPPPPNHGMQAPAGSNSAYYNQNPELAHV